MEHTDGEIIRTVLHGERDAFAQLVERYQRKVHAIAWSRLGDVDMTQDAAQETFLKAFRYLHTLRKPERFSSWLSRIADTVSVSLLRKKCRHQDVCRDWKLEIEHQQVESDHPAEERQYLEDVLSKTMADMDSVHRETLTLFYIEEKSIKKTANTLGISEAAVKTRLHRARNLLRDELELRLEEGLKHLRPKKDFVKSVMATLPALPVSGSSLPIVGSVLALLNKSWATIFLFFWMSLWFLLSFGGLMSWFCRMDMKNIHDAPENAFRKSIMKRNLWIIVILGIVVIIFARSIELTLGPVFLFQCIFVFSLFGLWQVIRLLRVNSSLYTKGNVFMMSAMSLSFLSIGFFGAPFYIFMVVMLLINVVLFFTQKEMPRRMDYNLFLRCATGGLKDSEETRLKKLALSPDDMKRFVQFLGENWLAVDYRIQNGFLVVKVPPVRNTMLNMFATVFAPGSMISIDNKGSVQACVHKTDWAAVEQHAETGPQDKDEICRMVENSVSNALAQFLEGNIEKARSILCAVQDEKVLKGKADILSSHKKKFTVVMLCGILWFVLMGLLYWMAGR